MKQLFFILDGGVVVPNKRKINVSIDGRNFSVVGAEDETYVRNLAYYVDQHIKNLASKNDRLDQTMAATLAALNIADELSKTSAKLKELEQRSKEPLEKFGGIAKELENAEKKVQELEKLCLEYKDELIKSKLSMEGQYNEVVKIKEELEMKDLEVEDLKKQNKALQEKNFQSNMELVEVKKELNELRLYIEA